MRPLYETEHSLAIERSMAAWLEPLWNCKLVKLPHAYRLDYAALRDQQLVAWLELKRRHCAFREFPTIFLSAHKVLAARALRDASRVPCFFVVQFNDCYAFADILARGHAFGFRGRTDRGDWQDIEPVALIPVEQFKIVG
jgi:hypothetical protein